jgi:cell shape-determining protein MreC
MLVPLGNRRQRILLSSKDQLRARIYSLLREVAHVPLSSPPRLKKTSSISASKEEILEEMIAKSSEIDFLKSNKTSLTELTNSEFYKIEEELD